MTMGDFFFFKFGSISEYNWPLEKTYRLNVIS